MAGEFRAWLREKARIADANSHEWQADQSSGVTDPNAIYRAGMWYAYHDVENQLPLGEQSQRTNQTQPKP